MTGNLPLEAWHDFYLLTSAAAATLVGLLFVVITLVSDRQSATIEEPIRIYLTPTVIGFASVLLLAGALIIPTQSRLSVALFCCGEGAAGVVYALSLLRGPRFGGRFFARAHRSYYALLPAAAFGFLIVGGAQVYASINPNAGLMMVALAMLALLALALRNSWAIAVTVISPPSGKGDTKDRG
jgi:hypothetical protein